MRFHIHEFTQWLRATLSAGDDPDECRRKYWLRFCMVCKKVELQAGDSPTDGR